MGKWFFDSWQDIGRVALIGTLAYIALIFIMRISGKRTLSKMNSFDFVVTIALGSTVATILLSKDVSLVEGLTALSLLVLLQLIVTFISVRSNGFNQLVKSQPTLLYYRGEFLRSAMRKERIHEHEILAAVRSAGIGSLQEVEAVVLETQGELSALKRSDSAPTALRTVGDASFELPPAAP